MSRIQIPLDALTSRLNLSDRLQGFRPGPLTGRFSNLRPVSEFLDFKRVSKPANFAEMQSRVNYNLSHFSSNYAVVFSMLSIYALLTNWVLLFDIVLVVVGMFLIGRLEGRDLEIGTFRASSSQLYTGLLIVAVPLGLIASPFSTLLWLIGASGVAILGHASFMDKPIDEAFSGEARFWQHHARVEELDTEDGDDGGLDVQLQRGRRFVSDSLQFTGIDLGDRTGDMVSRRPRDEDDYDDDDDDDDDTCSDEDDEDEDEAEDDGGGDDSEEEGLVQSALQRIDRARARGKADVRLNKDELAALERRRRRMREDEERRRRRARVAVPLTHLEPISRPRPAGAATTMYGTSDQPRHVSAGSMVEAPGPEQRQALPPMGYFAPPVSSHPRLRSGASSTTTTTSRHVSDSATRLRSIRYSPPDDNSLPPASRTHLDPFVYQTAGPRQGVGRRHVSGPAEMSSGRRGEPRPRSYGDETSSDEGESSGSGVVSSRLRERPARGRVVAEASSSPARKKGSPASAKKKASSSSGGKRRKK
ncbi:hypothetical protein L249_4217 [Ophiocordyceps polyrhachis-furcata BCC 54312]|uniref:PRA1 family protein n=1 Tax=Ophiocordyceps polyrhachis-furcata BCC 54312 TaxID=1330021 RepID=A0A367LBW2_9HYPO|nr:hypothetical protein L249_4217 [Ophiocordyceps polyrhachis-furcata BCC 54312]